MSSIQLENINKIKYLKSVLDRVSSYGIDVSSYFDELNTIIDNYEDDKKIELSKEYDKINLTMDSDPEFDLGVKLEVFSIKINWCILFISFMDVTDSWNLDVNVDEVFSLVYNKIDSILENISDVDIQEKIVIRYYDLVLKKILKDYDNKVYEYLDEYNDIDKYVYLMDSIKRYLESKNIYPTEDEAIVICNFLKENYNTLLRDNSILLNLKGNIRDEIYSGVSTIIMNLKNSYL